MCLEQCGEGLSLSTTTYSICIRSDLKIQHVVFVLPFVLYLWFVILSFLISWRSVLFYLKLFLITNVCFSKEKSTISSYINMFDPSDVIYAEIPTLILLLPILSPSILLALPRLLVAYNLYMFSVHPPGKYTDEFPTLFLLLKKKRVWSFVLVILSLTLFLIRFPERCRENVCLFYAD